MAKQRTHGFRVGKIEIIKTFARRPKGFYRPDLAHKDAKKYDRRKARVELRKQAGE
jgi:hypothetical protein